MSYRFLRHTADLRMFVSGKTPEELFREAMKGMAEIMQKSKTKDQKLAVKRTIKLKATDRTALLVDFLNQVLAQAQINKEIYTDAEFKKLSETALEAELMGAPVDEFDEDIKAVTYHEADIKKNEKGEWETTLVFDI